MYSASYSALLLDCGLASLVSRGKLLKICRLKLKAYAGGSGLRQTCTPVADLEGAEPSPAPFGRRTDTVTHGTPDM